MAENEYEVLQLVGRHIPDENGGPFASAQEALAAGHDTVNPATGMYEIGAIVRGAFVPLVVEKASLVFDKIALAAENPANVAQPAASQPAEGQPQPVAPQPTDPQSVAPQPAEGQPQPGTQPATEGQPAAPAGDQPASAMGGDQPETGPLSGQAPPQG